MCAHPRQHGIFLSSNGEVFVGQWIGAFPPEVDVALRPEQPPSPHHRGGSAGFKAREAAFLDVGGMANKADASPIFWHAPTCRDGWGVWLHKTERYEGEWSKDMWHGIGFIDNRGGDRYVGQFRNGCKSGSGLCISTAGVLHAEIWDEGEFVEKTPIFREIDGISVEQEAAMPHQADAVVTNDPLARSKASAMDLWTVDEVANLLLAAGFEASSVEQLRVHRINGVALGTLTSGSALPLLESTFGKHRPNPSLRLLVLAVEILLKFRQKLSAPKIADEDLKNHFHDLEIQDGLSFGVVIGEGGYGTVYKSRWMHTDVAAKAFRVADQSRVCRALYSELNVLQKLRHPNVTLLIGFCFVPTYIIVTELVDGGSLHSVLHRSRDSTEWNFSRMICTAKEICLGMVYLHANGIVHCDLKSSNVLLTKSFDVKLSDFGLAHLLGDVFLQEQLSINIGVVGTHQWMAPEVLRGEGYTKAADVYSYGMIQWEMISRQVPFEGYTAAQIAGVVGYGHQRPQLPRNCPEPLCVELQKALNPIPQARCSFNELAEDLGKLHRSCIIDVEESLWAFFMG